MTVKVLAFDLDGTLLRKDQTVDPRTADAIHRAIDAGMHVVLATGRDRAGCEFVYKPLGLDKGENFLALVNGQILYDFANKEYDVDDVLTPEDSVKIQDICRKYGVEGIFCCGYDFYSYLTTPGRVRKQLRRVISGEPDDYGLKAASDVRTFANLPSRGRVIDKDINKVCMIHSPKFFEKNLPKLREELKAYDLLMVGDNWLEIMPHGVSKASALRKVAEKVGCTMNEVMAFGDAENDIPMLKEAGIGVAMGNAMETAKEAASYVTDTNENNGIGKAIDLVLAGKQKKQRPDKPLFLSWVSGMLAEASAAWSRMASMSDGTRSMVSSMDRCSGQVSARATTSTPSWDPSRYPCSYSVLFISIPPQF